MQHLLISDAQPVGGESSVGACSVVWSPDGSSLAFMQAEAPSATVHLFSVATQAVSCSFLVHHPSCDGCDIKYNYAGIMLVWRSIPLELIQLAIYSLKQDTIGSELASLQNVVSEPALSPDSGFAAVLTVSPFTAIPCVCLRILDMQTGACVLEYASEAWRWISRVSSRFAVVSWAGTATSILVRTSHHFPRTAKTWESLAVLQIV